MSHNSARLAMILEQYSAALLYPDRQELGNLLMTVTPDERMSTLKTATPFGDTPLHRAAWCGHTDIIDAILSSLITQERKDLLMSMDHGILHFNAMFSHVESVEAIMVHLTAEEKLHMISKRTASDGLTAIGWALSKGYTAMADKLREIKQEAELHVSNRKEKGAADAEIEKVKSDLAQASTDIKTLNSCLSDQQSYTQEGLVHHEQRITDLEADLARQKYELRKQQEEINQMRDQLNVQRSGALITERANPNITFSNLESLRENNCESVGTGVPYHINNVTAYQPDAATSEYYESIVNSHCEFLKLDETK